MTTLQIYESIKQIFPKLLESQIIAEMNHAQDKFARTTQILKKVGVLKTITTKVSWDVPSEVVELYEVELYDGNGIALDKINVNIDWVVDGRKLIFYDTTSAALITSIPTSISEIWTRYSYLPTTLALVGTALTIDTQFTEAVLAGALESLYGRMPVSLGTDNAGNSILRIDFNAVKYWASKYKTIEIEAKKWINSLDSTPSRTRNYQFAGYFTLPKEAKDANITPENWT